MTLTSHLVVRSLNKDEMTSVAYIVLLFEDELVSQDSFRVYFEVDGH